MRRFDCLSPDCPLFGSHLLEASAGTGKTFSIEHVFVRLLLEKLELEEILAVTFTRAATRELKKRIRDNVEKALFYLASSQDPWGYLTKYFDDLDVISCLKRVLENFDRCQIFTIHSFCSRMLREFAFEAKIGFSLAEPDGLQSTPRSIRTLSAKFLQDGLTSDILCPEQIAKLIRNGSLKELTERLLKSERKIEPLFRFSSWEKRFLELYQNCPYSQINEEMLLSDFSSLRANYKKKDGNFPLQIRALVNKNFRDLLKEEGSLFHLLSPSNQKLRSNPIPSLHYPQFFSWCHTRLLPLIEEATDEKKIFAALASRWHEVALSLYRDENHFQPDDLLIQMRHAIQSAPFAERISKKYRTVIIDEFQDTDPVQWEIFSTLFLSPSTEALYLVGDPKQSIYSFRNADVYTYFAARQRLGEAHLYHLDTNFRSTPPLIEALNALFARQSLPLPKIQENLPYLPIRAGASLTSPIRDEKGAIHWVNVKQLYILEYAVQEIERLVPFFPNYSSFAILVKDRYQAQKALHLLERREIPAKARSRTPIGQTDAFRAIKELFEAVLDPRDVAKSRAVSLGPFSILGTPLPLVLWRLILEEEGLVSFAKQVLTPSFSFYLDARQIFEVLFVWEQKQSFSFIGLQQFLKELEELDPDEGGRRRMDESEDAVEVLTTHASKGLEFDVVFAFGLGLTPSETNEELDAEKLRQLYVAMTRAKYRLYVPGIPDKNSPMAMFCENGALLELTSNLSISQETIDQPLFLSPRPASTPIHSQPLRLSHSYFPIYLHSFTSLAKSAPPSSPISQNGLPLGSEIGILFHAIFETLFSSPDPLWKYEKTIRQAIQQHLVHSPFQQWEEEIFDLIDKTLVLQVLDQWCLKDLEPGQMWVEQEFLFQGERHFVKGYIDLIFCHDGKYYLVDWKSNWVKETGMRGVMDDHDYWLQAALYGDALKRYVGTQAFGGAFYFFLRAKDFLYFQPENVHGI